MGRRLKLTDAQAYDIKRWKKHTDLSDEKIGKRFGVSATTAAKVVTGNYRPTGAPMQAPTPKPTLFSFTVAGAILDALADPKIAMTNDQIKQAWALLKTRHTNNTAAAASNFRIGDEVEFESKSLRNFGTKRGIVKKINVKSITVMVGDQRWTVSPALLTKVP